MILPITEVPSAVTPRPPTTETAVMTIGSWSRPVLFLLLVGVGYTLAGHPFDRSPIIVLA